MNWWVYIGILYLILLTYQDYKNNMMIDDRYNYFMFGFTIALFQYYDVHWWYILIIMALAIGLGIFIGFTKAMGRGDIKTILWSFVGFGLISLHALIGYLICFLGIFIFHYLIARLFMALLGMKKNVKTQGYPILLISFVLNSFIFSLF